MGSQSSELKPGFRAEKMRLKCLVWGRAALTGMFHVMQSWVSLLYKWPWHSRKKENYSYQKQMHSMKFSYTRRLAYAFCEYFQETTLK